MHIYSVDTSFFYNDKEMKLHKKLNKTYSFKNKLYNIKNNKNTTKELKVKIEKHISFANDRIKKHRDELQREMNKNNKTRLLREDALSDKSIISVFDSVLTRTLNIKENTLTRDIIVVQTYFFKVLEDIIKNGFIWNNEKYICFTASAGQIRTKKTMFIRENVFCDIEKTLTCGLTPNEINKKGGININKYLAYLALCNSATDKWDEFNIDRAIVVDDLETDVKSVVDFIDEKTYQIKRQEMNIPIEHTDGAGMILPSVSNKSFMIRLPWIKGLLVPFSFDKFAQENNSYKIKDIYGKEWDIIKDNIEVIFTKSQFKMWKYYSSWEEYKINFKKFNCQAGKCNEEEDNIGNAKLNYQMLQTLTDMTVQELEDICTHTKNNIINIGRDRKTMLRVLGVTDSNKRKNYIQQALDIYPELLSDTYSKEILKQVKKSMVKEARAGKIDIRGKYTFICPDLYAFCERLFLGIETPKGLLEDGEVYCSLYKNENKLDVLRSPHLYREHAIRKNIIDEQKSKWFITKGIYTSIHDPISKLLQFDADGDKALVCADHTIINVAERNMKDIVPLYYNMASSGNEEINNTNIFNGLKNAYTGGNIGMISNDITKVWNSDNVNLDVIKLLCAENNFVIDYAKTLYKPVRPKDIGKTINSFTRSKVPHFFIYAKDKTKKEVENWNDTTVNKLEKIIPNPRISFKAANIGKFDYKMLMSGENVNVDLNKGIIDKYTELDLQRYFMINKDDEKYNNIVYTYQNIRSQLLMINSDKNYVTDVLIEYLYKYKKSNLKTTLWECFGDVIVENLKRNIRNKYGDNIHRCVDCKEMIEITSNRRKYCEPCWKEREREQTRERVRRHRNVTV